jgi:uncharacterized membrane protein YbhN (UPF0104 family)
MAGAERKLTARPVTGPTPGVSMPREFEPRRLLRRALQVGAAIAVVVLIVALAPGLGEVRSQLEGARPGWIALAVALEALSCASYVVMFKPMFCPRMPWRTSWEIGLSELAMGSIVPASGAGGLALGAWILREGGMPGDQIARRSVAFFLLKSSVNFAAVAIVGTLMAVGLLGPHRSLLLTALPAAAATIVIGLVLLIPRVAPREHPGPDAGRVRRAVATLRRWVIDGTTEAVAILRTGRGNWQVLVGAFGYWFWDNAVIWATFHAFGYSPAVAVVLMGYLIGQLGGALPLPGGLGGIDGGLFGTFLVYGTPAAVTAAAVLAYRVILFWLPLLVGTIAFFSLRRGLNDPDRPELCVVPAAT